MTAARLLVLLAAAVPVFPAAAAAAEAPPRLVGTLLVPGTTDRAVFEDGAGRQVARRVGDTVMPGLRLEAVRRGMVDLVDGAGRRVTLRAGEAAGLALERAERAGIGSPRPEARVARAAAAAGREPRAAGDEAAVHPAHVRHGSRLAHAHTGGRFEGLRLVGGPPDTPLVRAGLLPGDLIVAVGGRPLDGEDPRLVASLLETLDSADTETPLLVEARRGDEVIEVAVGAH